MLSSWLGRSCNLVVVSNQDSWQKVWWEPVTRLVKEVFLWRCIGDWEQEELTGKFIIERARKMEEV